MKKQTLYLIMDGRYNFDPDRAVVCSVCYSRKEAEEEKINYGADSVIVETNNYDG